MLELNGQYCTFLWIASTSNVIVSAHQNPLDSVLSERLSSSWKKILSCAAHERRDPREKVRIRFMFTLRRYRPADLEAVTYLHVYALEQTGAYLGRGPWDDDVYAIEEA